MSVTLNFVCTGAEKITQVDDHVKIRLTLQLINSISRVLETA